MSLICSKFDASVVTIVDVSLLWAKVYWTCDNFLLSMKFGERCLEQGPPHFNLIHCKTAQFSWLLNNFLRGLFLYKNSIMNLLFSNSGVKKMKWTLPFTRCHFQPRVTEGHEWLEMAPSERGKDHWNCLLTNQMELNKDLFLISLIFTPVEKNRAKIKEKCLMNNGICMPQSLGHIAFEFIWMHSIKIRMPPYQLFELTRPKWCQHISQ